MESRYVLVQYFEKYKHRTDFFIVANVTFFFLFFFKLPPELMMLLCKFSRLIRTLNFIICFRFVCLFCFSSFDLI